MITKKTPIVLSSLFLTSACSLQAGETFDDSPGNNGSFLDGINPFGTGSSSNGNANSSSGGNTSPWDITAAANAALAQGNADSFSYSLQGLATYKGEVWEGLVGADYFYSENEGEETTNSFRIFGQGQRLITDRFYLGLAGSVLIDEVADIDYRIDVAAVLGYHLIKSDRTSLSLEFGPGYAWESQGGDNDQFATVRFSQRFEHQFSKRTKIWQSATFTPAVEDFDDYFLTLDAGLDIALNNQWAFRPSIRYTFDNTPATGQQEDDLTLLFGLAYSLGGFPEPEEAGRASLKPDTVASAEPAKGWTTTGNLSVSLAEGNSDNLLATVGLDSAYRTDTDEFIFGASYTFGENEGETSSDILRASVQYNRLLSERLYAGLGSGFLRNDLSDVDYRFTPNVLLGYYLIKNDTMSLAFEGGPAYVFEEVDGVRDDYFSLRFAERFVWQIGNNLSFNQAAVIDVDPSDSENFLATVTASLNADITANLAWRLGLTYTFDNIPAPGLDESDINLTSGIAVQF